MHIPMGNDWVVAFAAITRIGALAMPCSTLYAPAELERVLRLGDIHLLLAPDVMFERDHTEFLERAVPGLASSESSALRLPAVPYLRSIVLLGDHIPTLGDAGGRRVLRRHARRGRPTRSFPPTSWS